MIVEHLSGEQGVETGTSVNNILCFDVRINSELFAVLHQSFSFLNRCQSPVVLLEVVADMFEDMPIGHSVGHILPKILNLPLLTIQGHVVVQPPNQNLLWLQFVDNTFVFVLGFEQNHLWYAANVDVTEDVDSNDLPDEPKDKMLLFLSDELRLDVNNHTAN